MGRDGDLERFKQTLPYSSEIFGVYQPLLGWKARRAQERFDAALEAEKLPLVLDLRSRFRPRYVLDTNATGLPSGINLSTGQPGGGTRVHDTVLMQELQKQLPPREEYDPGIWADLWSDLLSVERLDIVLQEDVRRHYLAWAEANGETFVRERGGDRLALREYVEQNLRRESVTAGLLHAMAEEGLHAELRDLFYGTGRPSVRSLLHEASHANPFDLIDPRRELDRVGLSPVGIAHLFRQYFFEFETFLGPAVGHIWISPQATVELLEVSTRRTYTEQVTEQTLESIIKTETAAEDQDEISDAVKIDNRSEAKFGANARGEESWVWGSANQSASFDLTTTQETAREQAHKHMRQQSEKLSTEIRKNYKSTFRVVTETTDTSSKRYVLTNPGPELLNYELRRKMRQVGVQVQDIGTYLCWQAYVDEPGRHLGIAELVHIAKSSETQLQPPESPVRPQPKPVQVPVEIPFVQTSSSAGDLDEGFRDGREIDTDPLEGSRETIQADFPMKVSPPEPGYRLHPNITFDKGGADIELSVRDFKEPEGPVTETSFTVHLDYVNFKGHSPIRVMAALTWMPRDELIQQVEADYQKRMAEFKQKESEQQRKDFYAAARERIKLASKIQSRRYEDLREEERIVVYRALIQDMLTKGIPLDSDATRHAASELIDSIFDVDKMLYFVAPEWWKPRKHHAQVLGNSDPPPAPTWPHGGAIKRIGRKAKPEATVLPSQHLVSWGKANEARDDNYYITEESDRAKLGASLGWLLQLDGDDLRNAFLNAPWVKAVIPIRPGKDKAALNWLKQVEGLNGIGPDDMYAGDEPSLQGKTMLEALEILAAKVSAKHKDGLTVGQYPPEELDDANKVSATPIDKVFEHGFYPLKGGFRVTPGQRDPDNPDGHFEVFDQWVEVLPTDQIVAVQVKYDPKTGRQVDA